MLALAASTAAACRRGAPPRPPEPQAAIVGPENTIRVSREVIRTGPRLSGLLEPRDQARVRAELGGAVTHEDAELGAAVRKGDVLVRIESTALRDAYRSAQSALRAARLALASARSQLTRTERLVQAGALSTAGLEGARDAFSAAQAGAAQARSQLAQAHERLASATVAAPMTGLVSEAAVNRGDVVAPGTPLFTVIDPASMRLTAAAPSEDLPALRVGARVDFAVRGFPNEAFRGRIERIAPAVDPETRLITVFVTLPNPGGKLLAGLFAEGRVGAQSKETLVVPRAAVDESAEPPSVRRIENGRVARVPVTLGLQDPQTERVEIGGAVRAGDVLLTGAAKEIAPGTPVLFAGAGQAANP
jgi:RND family efflux transporter MFP subunit